jgi:hypothetical protein
MSIRLAALCLFACLAAPLAHAEALTEAKTNDIKQLMQITGSGNLAKQYAGAISQQMFMALKAARPDVPDRAFAVMNTELLAFFTEKMNTRGGLIDQIIPIYAKNFSDQEIRDVIAFYNTPTGKKVIQVLPVVLKQSIEAGQKWGQAMSPEIQARVVAALDKEGLLPKAKPKKQ